MMVVLMLSMVLMWTLYGNIATFYPPYVEENHASITSTMVGFVLAMFEAGCLVASPIVSVFMSRIGRRNCIIFGNVAMVVASMGFGLIAHIENDIGFFISSLLLRVMMGFGDAASSTAIFSIIGSEFTADRDVYFGYFESAVGAGLMLGPIIGQLLYTPLKFEKTFYCTGAIMMIPLIF